MHLRNIYSRTLGTLLLASLLSGCEPQSRPTPAPEQPAGPEPTEASASAPEQSPGAAVEEPAQGSAVVEAVDAKALYTQQCALCHMDDGSGVPDLQPPLAGSELVTRESPDATIRSILLGSESPDATGDWGNPMPGFADFTNAQVAALATYVRTHFGNSASSVTVEDVARVRE